MGAFLKYENADSPIKFKYDKRTVLPLIRMATLIFGSSTFDNRMLYLIEFVIKFTGRSQNLIKMNKSRKKPFIKEMSQFQKIFKKVPRIAKL